MKKSTGCRINEEDILKVELLCSCDVPKDFLKTLLNQEKQYQGKEKNLYDCFFILSHLVNSYDNKLALEGIRVITTDNVMYHFSIHDFKEREIVIEDNILEFMWNIVSYVQKQECLSIKVLNIETLDYVDYYQGEKILNKMKGKK